MAYEMKSKASSGSGGRRGLAKVTTSKDGTKVRVIFKDDPGAPAYIPIEDCPEYYKDGKWRVSLNADETIMYGLYPEKGTFEVKVKEFVSGEDGVPEPRYKYVSFVRDGKDNSYEYEYFMVIAEILNNPASAGMEVPLMMRYNFDAMKEDGKEVACYSKPRSKYTSDLVDFMDAVGVLEFGAIPYSDNILPEIQKRVAKNDRTFSITLKDGWLVNGSIMALESPDESEVPWEETATETPEHTEPTQTPDLEFEESDFD